MVLTPNNMIWLTNILKGMPVSKQIAISRLCSCIQGDIIAAQLEGKTEYITTRQEIIDMVSVTETKNEVVAIVICIFKKAGYAVNGKYGSKGNYIRFSWANAIIAKKNKNKETYEYYNLPITNLKSFYMGRVRLDLTEKIKPSLIDMNLVNMIRVASETYISKYYHKDMIFKLLTNVTNDSSEGITLSKMIRGDIIEILSPKMEITAGNIFIDISKDVDDIYNSRGRNVPDAKSIKIFFDIKIVPDNIAMGMITEELNNSITKDRGLIERCAHALGLIK